MPTGILICGLNGAGKSTLGKALAEKSGFRFLDIEDLYFPRLAPGNPYASPRSRSEVEKLLFQELSTKENFILASVKADYGEAIYPFFQLAVLVDVPKEVRLQRVRNRSFQKFGSRAAIYMNRSSVSLSWWNPGKKTPSRNGCVP